MSIRVLVAAALAALALTFAGCPAQAAPRPVPWPTVTAGQITARPKPGDAVAVPFTVSAGAGGNRGVVISFDGSTGLDTADRPSNCSYGRAVHGGFHVYCVLEGTTLEAGGVYAPLRPPRFRLAERALNERVEIRADPIDGLEYARERVGEVVSRGDGPPLRLVRTDRPAGPVGRVPGTTTVDVLADSSTDHEIVLAERTFTGAVGDTVLLRPEWRKGGPGFYRSGVDPFAAPPVEVEYVVPGGMSPVERRDLEHCRTRDSAEGHRYRCLTAEPLELRIDKALEGARGSVSVVPGAKEDGLAFERDRTNDSVVFTVTAAPARGALGTNRWAVAGAVLLTAAVVLVGGVLVLRVRRGRPAALAGILAGALACAVAGTAVLVGPGRPDRPARGFPAPRYRLVASNLWDDSRIHEPRPAGVPTVTTSRDDANERGMTPVSAFFSSAAAGGGIGPDLWIAVDGAYGSIRDPDRARRRMLEEAARAEGVVLVRPPVERTEKGVDGRKVTLACQSVTVRGEGFDMCAWADGNTRAVVTTAASARQGGAAVAVSVRDEMRLEYGVG
ncbi:hypothetical protein ACIRQF_21595 [Streptomyces sp. NPDC101191]|uniref:hypothetical protein n=1 Tax=Streptomyces sp. NPDC101191 TaxID=3366126 RepID=UPI00380DCFD5